MRKLLKVSGYTLLAIALLFSCLFVWIVWGLAPALPQPADKSSLQLEREKAGENFYRIGNNMLRKTRNGLWEAYIEGDAFERGVITGKLERELLYTQELAFVEQIHSLVPNNTYLKFLGYFTRVFNRNLSEHVTEENKLEIYGESFSAPKAFDYISPAYDRMLNYHAAHDIGHALQSLALVGCSSFAAWDGHTADSSMIIGRNLDFYLGDKFAEDKIVYFCNPKQGHKFAMITWAGFMGCVSGMNEKGLTVTINAAKSDVPSGATTPISLLAREILQYAGNIQEAFSIASKRKTFVCETLMIGSAADHKTALIEKSISKTVLLHPDTNYILCTNHYQSKTFSTDKNNLENIRSSASMYRFNRLEELLSRYPKLDYKAAAEILRDQRGLNDRNIGMGNEKALNQLISHHGIVFQPEKLRFWVSANPYQLGEFVCYDLNKVFAEAPSMNGNAMLNDTALTVAADTFLYSNQWNNFLKWREYKQQVKDAIKQKKAITDEEIFAKLMTSANPEFWETYYWLGEYFHSRNQPERAKQYFETALSKEINDFKEVEAIRKQLKKLNN
ncbi:MAG: peptidase C45 [Chitinophagales bacterium]|nr:peptidase C45 [Chitinophagales bacterium]